jgi:hypothetical protein
MSVDVTVEKEIRRDRDAVARFVMDPANDTRWRREGPHRAEAIDGGGGIGMIARL